VLDEHGAKVATERSTRDPMSEAEVRALLGAVAEVVIARGRKAERRPAREVEPKDLKGPTGNFRAPMVRQGTTLLVGFHPETLSDLL
jgi:hypothetical protein